jgi:hypothetical protein
MASHDSSIPPQNTLQNRAATQTFVQAVVAIEAAHLAKRNCVAHARLVAPTVSERSRARTPSIPMAMTVVTFRIGSGGRQTLPASSEKATWWCRPGRKVLMCATRAKSMRPTRLCAVQRQQRQQRSCRQRFLRPAVQWTVLRCWQLPPCWCLQTMRREARRDPPTSMVCKWVV